MIVFPTSKPMEATPKSQVSESEISLPFLNISRGLLCEFQLNHSIQNEAVQQYYLDGKLPLQTFINSTEIIPRLLEWLQVDGLFLASWSISYPLWFRVIFTALFVITMTWSVLANTHTCLAIASQRSRWTSTNLLLTGLALSDLLFVCVIVPPEISSVAGRFSETWVFGRSGCRILPYLQSAALLANTLMLCLIAYDRYLGVVHVFDPGMLKRVDLVLLILGLVWLLAFGLAGPTIQIWEQYIFLFVNATSHPVSVDFCNVLAICTQNSDLKESDPNFAYTYYVFLCCFIFIPLFFVYVFLYLKIAHFLWVRKPVTCVTPNMLQKSQLRRNQTERKKKVIKSLVALVTTFFICRMPNWIFAVLSMAGQINANPVTMMVRTLFIYLSVFNTAINPWFYVLISDPMRKALKDFRDSCCESVACCQAPTWKPEFPNTGRPPERKNRPRTAQRNQLGPTIRPENLTEPTLDTHNPAMLTLATSLAEPIPHQAPSDHSVE